MGHTLDHVSTRKKDRKAFSVLSTGLNSKNSFIFDGEILSRYMIEAGADTNTPSRKIQIVDANGVTYFDGPTFPDGKVSQHAPTGGIELDGKYDIYMILGATGSTLGVSDYLTMFVI